MMRMKPGFWAAAIATTMAAVAPGSVDKSPVIAASESPKGYSLSRMAFLTADYNTGIQSGNPDTPAPPNVPFEILVGDVTVPIGTSFYLPVFDADNSGTVPAGFPSDITDQSDDMAFLKSYVKSTYNVDAFIVQIDGKTTILDENYIVGVKTPALLDGPPAGTEYIVCAAFLSPLKLGAHTVAIGGIVKGRPVAFLTYSVTVSAP